MKNAPKKIDLRFNDVKEAIIEVSDTLKNCPLNDEALAVLVASSSKGKISKSQVQLVLKGLNDLQKHYLRPIKG